MIVKIDISFEKEITSFRNPKIYNRIFQMVDNVQTAINIKDIKEIKKLKGYKNYYRIRIGDYRAGVIIENNIVTFVRFLHRKDIFKRFP